MRSIVLSLLAVGFLSNVSQAQLRTYTTTEADSMECVQSLSLYIEFFKQDNYEDAVKGWRTAAEICPKATESLWVNGIKIYQERIQNEKDAAKNKILVDSLMWAYDQRIEHFGEKEGYIRGRKGTDIMKFSSSSATEAFEEFEKAYELEKNNLEPGATLYYFKSTYDLYRDNAIEDSKLFEVYDRASQIIEANSSGDYAKYYEQAQSNIDNWIGAVADCEKLISIFKPKFDANPGDASLIAQITKLLDKQKCGDRDFYLDVAVAGYTLNPTPQAAFDIAKGYYSKDKYSDALKYFKEAAEGAQDNDLKFDAYRFSASASLKLGSSQSAKTYANKMLQINPNSGEAYIIIGDAYTKSNKACGDNQCTNRAAYWAAVDKYARAKSVDPSVAEQAQARINTYSAQFPKKEDCFFHGITEGTSYTFDCWIGETTTVRTRAN